MQMKPPTKATMTHMSMERLSTRMCGASGAGWASSVQKESAVCATDSKITGYFLYLTLRTTMSAMRNTSPASMAWPTNPADSYKSTVSDPPESQASRNPAARAIRPPAPA